MLACGAVLRDTIILRKRKRRIECKKKIYVEAQMANHGTAKSQISPMVRSENVGVDRIYAEVKQP